MEPLATWANEGCGFRGWPPDEEEPAEPPTLPVEEPAVTVEEVRCFLLAAPELPKTERMFQEPDIASESR